MSESTRTVDELGTVRYYNAEGRLHHEGGPAVEWASGLLEWYVNGHPHRIGGPAFTTSDGYKSWWLDGRRHNGRGPAVIRPDGQMEYWIHGVEVSKDQFEELTGIGNEDDLMSVNCIRCSIQLPYDKDLILIGDFPYCKECWDIEAQWGRENGLI